MIEKIYILGISKFLGIGPKRFQKLINKFKSAKNIWHAGRSDLKDEFGIIGNKFYEFKENFDLENYDRQLREKDIKYFIQSENLYSQLLKKIPNPPIILFAKGNTKLLNSYPTIGIVGTRKVTEYGREVTEMFTKSLVRNNFVIVSGMALGVDGIAHEVALRNNGLTIAVLGGGVDMPTPAEHAGLYREILNNNGLIVSTFSPGEDAHKGSFPARNEIIAGFSQSLLVTEGAEDSGSLITANFAKKFNRLVFAVPGQITSQLSKGTNNLIKNGAIPVSSTQDILDTLGIINFRKTQINQINSEIQKIRQSDNPIEQSILSLLESGPLHFDKIVRTIGKDSSFVGSLLSLMELKGMIISNSKGEYNILQ